MVLLLATQLDWLVKFCSSWSIDVFNLFCSHYISSQHTWTVTISLVKEKKKQFSNSAACEPKNLWLVQFEHCFVNCEFKTKKKQFKFDVEWLPLLLPQLVQSAIAPPVLVTQKIWKITVQVRAALRGSTRTFTTSTFPPLRLYNTWCSTYLFFI